MASWGAIRVCLSSGSGEASDVSYTIKNLREVEDLAARHGFGET